MPSARFEQGQTRYVDAIKIPEIDVPYRGDIVVTGVAGRTRFGDIEQTWKAMLEGRNSAIKLDLPEIDEGSRVAAPFPDDFDPISGINERKDSRFLTRMGAMTVVDGRKALAMAGLLTDDGKIDTDKIRPGRTSIVFGTGFGQVATAVDLHKVTEEKGSGKVGLDLPLGMFPEQPLGRFAMAVGIKGGRGIVNNGACGASAISVDIAKDLIRSGRADTVVVIGSETALGTHPRITMAGFNAVHALADRNNDPERASRPFDADRNGFVPADGEGIMILERADIVETQGREPLAKINRTNSAIDGHHVTQGDPDVVAQALTNMLVVPGTNKILLPDAYLAHATGTKTGELAEIEAIKKTFGNAFAEHRIPVYAPKSSINHLMGAAGIMAGIIAVLSIRDGQIPPNVNLKNPINDWHFPRESVLYQKSNSIGVLGSGFAGFNGMYVVERV